MSTTCLSLYRTVSDNPNLHRWKEVFLNRKAMLHLRLSSNHWPCTAVHGYTENQSTCRTMLSVIPWLAVVYSDSYICERKHMFWHAAQSAGPGSCICNYLYDVIPLYSVHYLSDSARVAIGMPRVLTIDNHWIRYRDDGHVDQRRVLVTGYLTY